MKMKFMSVIGIFAIILLLNVPLLADAEENPSIFLAPNSMNEKDEIPVLVYTQNLPKDNDGLCGTEFQFTYDSEQFSIKKDENNRPILETNSAMLVQNTDVVDVSEENDIVSVSYVDFSGEDNLVLRDGPLFAFTLIPKNPKALWNSEDYYPIRFIPGSVNLITLDRQNFTLLGISAEGIDTYVGGYNAFPTFDYQELNKDVEFIAGDSSIYVDGEKYSTDTPPYVKDEFMIPIRCLAEAIDMELNWDGENRIISLYLPYSSTYFVINENDIYINSKLRMDLGKPEIVNDRTFVPLSTIQAIFQETMEVNKDDNKILLSFK